MPPIDEPFPTAGEAPPEPPPDHCRAAPDAGDAARRAQRPARAARRPAGPAARRPLPRAGEPDRHAERSRKLVSRSGRGGRGGLLEVYLRGLAAPEPAPESAPEAMPEVAGAVLPFHGPEAASDLGRLPGAGPGLVQALGRAGLARLADLARLEPEALAARLGPIGRLIPAAAWIAVARAETAAPDAAPPPRRAEAATAR